MEVIKNAFKAENEALSAMVDSMEKSIEQVKSWEGELSGTAVMSCKSMAESLARIGAGQIELADAKTEALISITGDLGHDVSFGLYNLASNTKVVRRTVHQPITLSTDVTWVDIINVMKVAIEYMEERIRVNKQAF